MMKSESIAIIPARGGSKRIPRKNVRDFCGKPMIAWTILTARESELFDAIVVSTDDEEIAAVAESYGAVAPFRRPVELANDHAPTLPVIAHAIRCWEEQNQPLKTVCCIYATAPLLRPDDLCRGAAALRENQEVEFAFGITSYAFPIFRALRRTPAGRVEMIWPENESTRSQDLEEAWHDAGQFYWGRRDAFLNPQPAFYEHAIGIELPRHLVQDIDTETDWAMAEQLFRTANAPKARP